MFPLLWIILKQGAKLNQNLFGENECWYHFFKLKAGLFGKLEYLFSLKQ